MFSPYSSTGRLLTAAIFIFVLVLFCAGEVSAQSEKELTEKAIVKMKLKKYTEAAATLKTAREKYPSSVEVAELTVQLCEETQAEAKELVDAYSELMKVLQMKQVVEGKLSSRDRRLLKKTEKKLSKLTKIRGEVDAAVKKFVSEGIAACKEFARLKKYTEASFVFQRLRAFAKGEELKEQVKNLAGELKGKAELLARPAAGTGKDKEKTKKLIRKAQRLFKSRKFDEARVACKAALETDPNLPEAVAMLYDIAAKTKATEEILTQGLSYLLFPPQQQDTGRTEEIEKHIRKASQEMGKFFAFTAAAAEKICELVQEAVRGKREFDVEYAAGRLACLTHRTRKVEPAVSEAQEFFRGIKIFNGRSLSGWKSRWKAIGGGFKAKVSNKCLLLGDKPFPINIMYCTKVSTRGPFVLQFSFRVGKTMPDSPNRSGVSGIFVSIWADARPLGETDTTYMVIKSVKGLKEVRLLNIGKEPREKVRYPWNILAIGTFTSPLFESGKWYDMRIEYVRKKTGAGKIIINVNGREAANISVPDNVSPARTGYVGIGNQLFEYVKLRDIYLKP